MVLSTSASLGTTVGRSIVTFSERTELDLGIDLEGRAELEVFARLGGLGLEARVAGYAQVLLPDCLAESLLQSIAEHLLAHLAAVLLLHQTKRHFAGPEAVHAHVARDALEAILDLAVDFLRRERNVEPPLQRADFFYGRLHVLTSSIRCPMLHLGETSRGLSCCAGRDAGSCTQAGSISRTKSQGTPAPDHPGNCVAVVRAGQGFWCEIPYLASESWSGAKGETRTLTPFGART